MYDYLNTVTVKNIKTGEVVAQYNCRHTPAATKMLAERRYLTCETTVKVDVERTKYCALTNAPIETQRYQLA